MSKIRTICGEINASKLGITSVHEHTVYDTNRMANLLTMSLPDMIAGATAVEGGADIERERARRAQMGIMVPMQSMQNMFSLAKKYRTNLAFERRLI